MICYGTNQQTKAFINGIKITTNQTEQETVKQAIENQAEQVGKQLILQQGAQQEASMMEQDAELETEE